MRIKTNKHSTLDDYAGFNENPSSKENELERLISEKLNQRYNSRKREQATIQGNEGNSIINHLDDADNHQKKRAIRADSVPKNQKNNVNTVRTKSMIGTVTESGGSSLVNQQLNSNVSLF